MQNERLNEFRKLSVELLEQYQQVLNEVSRMRKSAQHDSAEALETVNSRMTDVRRIEYRLAEYRDDLQKSGQASRTISPRHFRKRLPS